MATYQILTVTDIKTPDNSKVAATRLAVRYTDGVTTIDENYDLTVPFPDAVTLAANLNARGKAILPPAPVVSGPRPVAGAPVPIV